MIKYKFAANVHKRLQNLLLGMRYYLEFVLKGSFQGV